MATNTIAKSITVGSLPERMLLNGTQLFVVNTGDNTISIVNLDTQTAISKKVEDSPNSLVLDVNNDLWVLCNGKVDYPPPTYNPVVISSGVLIQFSASDLTEKKRFELGNAGAGDLTVNGSKNRLYYRFAGRVYQQDIASTSLNATPFINRNFYGIGFDGQENIFYGADAGSFTKEGMMLRYTPNGTVMDSAIIGIGPNGFVFK